MKVINYRTKYGEDKFNEELQEVEAAIKKSICRFPNYTALLYGILKFGTNIEELDKRLYMRIGVPVKPMLAKPTKGIHIVLARFTDIKFTCEYKYDGYRA